MTINAWLGLFFLFSMGASAAEPAPDPSAAPAYGPRDQYAIVWGGGKKPADAALAMKSYKKDFALFKGSFQGLDGYPMELSGGRVKGLDTEKEIVLLGYCNDEQVKAAIAFYQSFHPAAYAKKIWSDWDNDRCPYPTGFDQLKTGARKKAGKLTFNIVSYGPMTVAYLWSARNELLQSKRIEVEEESDLAQDIACRLNLDPEHADGVLASCTARRTHTGGISMLTGHFRVSADSGRLRIKWVEDTKVVDTED